MLTDAVYLKERFLELKGLERSPPGAELVNLVQDKIVERPLSPPATKAKQSSTPPMTAGSQKSLFGHARSSSTTSVTKSDDIRALADIRTDPAPEMPPALPAASEAVVPDPSPSLLDHPVVGKGYPRDSGPEQNIELQTQERAQDIPLPTSPEGDAPRLTLDDAAEKSEPMQSYAPGPDAEIVSPSGARLHVKPQGQPHGVPSVNVKNRLAGLFAKRPPIPTIDVPNINLNNALAKVKLPLPGLSAPSSTIGAESSADDEANIARTKQETTGLGNSQAAQIKQENARADKENVISDVQASIGHEISNFGGAAVDKPKDDVQVDSPLQIREVPPQSGDIAITAKEESDLPDVPLPAQMGSQEPQGFTAPASQAPDPASAEKGDNMEVESLERSSGLGELVQPIRQDHCDRLADLENCQSKPEADGANEEGDTSGSTTSTFDSEAHSDDNLGPRKGTDDLDDID